MNRAATVLLFFFLSSTNFCPAAVFDANPRNLANRLYSALWIRDDPPAIAYGADALDPPLWLDTKHLLTGPSHQLALNILDEFLRTHAEKQISSPLKRALLQRDLWAIFDWSALTREDHVEERQQLQIRLAEILRRLALTSQELSSLPDNYAQGVASGMFAKQYDAANPDRPFLPPDLLDPHGPSVRVTAEWKPVAETHAYALSGRSSFLVFVRLPQGRQATLDYFRTLWNAPEPWIASALDGIDHGENPNLPQFPVGTQVALLRQMNLFDRDGTLVSTPITESIQFRVYRVITSRRDQNNIDVDFPAARTEQNFYELRLSQAQLLKGDSGGLHAVAPGGLGIPHLSNTGPRRFRTFETGRHRGAASNSSKVCRMPFRVWRTFAPYPQRHPQAEPCSGRSGPRQRSRRDCKLSLVAIRRHAPLEATAVRLGLVERLLAGQPLIPPPR